MKKLYNIICLCILPIYLSCSIKEQRKDCLCKLRIDLSEFSQIGDIATVMLWDNNKNVINESVSVSKLNNKIYSETIPKSILTASIISESANIQLESRILRVKNSNESGNLYISNYQIDCNKEFVKNDAIPHKQFAKIYLKFMSKIIAIENLEFKVKSNYNGLDLYNISPIKGILDFKIDSLKNNLLIFNIIRQTEDSNLRIEIYHKEKCINNFNLSKYLRGIQYDWNKTDLDDIFIEIDRSNNIFKIEIKDWKEGSYKKEIL